MDERRTPAEVLRKALGDAEMEGYLTEGEVAAALAYLEELERLARRLGRLEGLAQDVGSKVDDGRD